MLSCFCSFLHVYRNKWFDAYLKANLKSKKTKNYKNKRILNPIMTVKIILDIVFVNFMRKIETTVKKKMKFKVAVGDLISVFL